MRFKRYGKTYQILLETMADLEGILELDEALWMATSAPVGAYRCDDGFLRQLDADGNGRITSAEVKAEVSWFLNRVADRDQIRFGADNLPLTAVCKDTSASAALLDSARYVLRQTDEQDKERISVAQVRAFLASVQSQPLNGDGVILPKAAADADIAEFIGDVIACTGGMPDAGGERGIDARQLAEFEAAVPAYLQWQQTGQPTAGNTDPAVLVLGPNTASAFALFQQHSDRIDLFFRLCRLLRYDPRTGERIGGDPANLQNLAPSNPESVTGYLEEMPIAAPNVDGVLPLDHASLNPHDRNWITALRRQVLVPLLETDPPHLDGQTWQRIRTAFAPYQAYLDRKQGGMVEGLPPEKLKRYCNTVYAQATRALIEADLRVAATITDVRTVERLLLCQLYLRDFVNNFVSFPDLYTHTERALFELGVVVMDGRRFNFVLPVPDPAAHSTVAKASNLLVLYLEISGNSTEKFSAAVPVTSGTKGNLGVGKRGVFFNIRGREFDARVTNIIENPVSIREALCMPFVRLWRLLEGKIESWSLTAEKQLQAQFDKSVPVPGATTATASPEPGTQSAAQRGGLVMGVSVAAAALGSAFAFITKQLAGLEKLQIGLGLLGAALVVVLPITLIAVLKLRRQDLSSLLEGCGWAVNARMRLSSSQRRHFTSRPPFPAAAAGTPRHHWRLALLIAMLVLLGTSGTCRLLRQRQARPEPEQAIPAKQPGAVPAANPEAGSGP